MTGRIVAIFMMAIGVNGLLFAQLFGNLSPLSSGFAQRKGTALLIGFVTLVAGLIVNFKVARTTRIETGRIGPAERATLRIVVGLVIGWIGFGAVVYAMQDRLVFSPRSVSSSRMEQIGRDYQRAQEIDIVAQDGAVLRGWLLPPLARGADVDRDGNSAETPSPLILVFAGQGGEASSYFDLAERLPGMAWAFINYRGYGLSDGKPTDSLLFDDAVAVFDYFANRSDIEAHNIFALGGSLGTGVATYVAAHRPVAGVVLFSPYDRIGGGVTQDMMPWLPTGPLFRNGFDAATYAPAVTAPALAIVGNQDEVIRPARSRALLRHWGGGHRLVVLPEGDHYSVYEDDGAWRSVAGFVAGLLR